MKITLVLEIAFWLSIFAVAHSYVLYPLLLKLLSAGKKDNDMVYAAGDELPGVSIIIPAYNEEAVIGGKIESVLASAWPAGKMEIIVGSDGSTDRTNQIVRDLGTKYGNVKLKEFSGRSGKATVANQLVASCSNDLVILTDANIMFDRQTITELLKHFRNTSVALVDSNMQHTGLRKEGISMQEKTYIKSEVAIKNAEGRIWGTMMGPFGGCFAFRKSYYVDVPANFLVDDFYINMQVLARGGKAINELKALVYEDVSNELSEEFRRKVRIATGNFQNLITFFPMLFRFNGLSFSFFSHKVLRWLGPLFMITTYVSSGLLAWKFSLCNDWFSIYGLAFLSLNLLLLLPLLDSLLKRIGIHLFLLRLITHFLSMNLALLAGMFRFMGGVRSGTWSPTQRNQ